MKEKQKIEIEKRLAKLYKSKEAAEKSIDKMSQETAQLFEIRDNVYKSVQDMTVDHTTTKKAIKNMALINSYVKSIAGKVEAKEDKVKEHSEDIRRNEQLKNG